MEILERLHHKERRQQKGRLYEGTEKMNPINRLKYLCSWTDEQMTQAMEACIMRTLTQRLEK